MDAEHAIEVAATPGHFLGMPAARFLDEYWQKRPLLVRGAFPGFEPPLAPDELAGLACEEAALSRLIQHDRARDRWTVHTGPLDEALFARLPDRDWTLLVQDVDKWDGDVARLREPFDFLPAWRIDDVMVSYAEDGGGVGAHLDQYDVFLLQGAGRRRWRIDARPDPPTAFRDDVALKQLREFSPSHTWTLAAGDLLYLPPGVPHEGVADGACMTFSIGMRAPSRAELLLDFTEHVAEHLPENERYTDPDLEPSANAGEIDDAAVTRAARALGPLAGMVDTASLTDWFGRFITRYRAAQFAAPPPQAPDATHATRSLDRERPLLRHPWTRMAWSRNAEGTTLYAAGEAFACSTQLAEMLCSGHPIVVNPALENRDLAVLEALVEHGHLLVDRPS